MIKKLLFQIVAIAFGASHPLAAAPSLYQNRAKQMSDVTSHACGCKVSVTAPLLSKPDERVLRGMSDITHAFLLFCQTAANKNAFCAKVKTVVCKNQPGLLTLDSHGNLSAPIRMSMSHDQLKQSLQVAITSKLK